jgi:hypothetical protein
MAYKIIREIEKLELKIKNLTDQGYDRANE